MKATVKDIFKEIQSLNPKTSTISSIGDYVSQSAQMLSEQLRSELLSYLPKSSVAYKIVSDSDHFSEKQLWVVSFELEKNSEYTEMLAKSISELKEQIAYDKARKSAKRAAKSNSKKELKQNEAENKLAYSQIESGTIVEHGIFGIGKVTSETEDTITITFENLGEKILLKRFAKLIKK
jgi:hypothetical protein